MCRVMIENRATALVRAFEGGQAVCLGRLSTLELRLTLLAAKRIAIRRRLLRHGDGL